MDIAFLPFAASVLAGAFRTGHGQHTAVVFHGMAFAVILGGGSRSGHTALRQMIRVQRF
jgi:hypothetical protein